MNTTLPQTGEVFDLRYRIAGRLGCGVDGYVFGATELDTGKRVAIKCWTGSHAAQALAAQQHFIRAAHRARLFDNPHIVEVFTAESGRTVSYGVSEWLEGVPLAQYLDRARRSPSAAVFELIVPCMRAVAEAHAAGIIHGDIRAGHIFICNATRHRPAVARVFDFGRGFAEFPGLRYLPRELDEACRYTTPEVLSGAQPNARSDCYGFGVLLYELLAGEHPFPGNDASEVARAIVAGTPRLLASISPTIAPRLASVVERGMASDPDMRYSSLGEFVAALERLDPAHAYARRTGLALAAPAAYQARTPPPPPPARHDPPRPRVSAAPDMTTTAASWELTDPVALDPYRGTLIGRVRAWHAAVLVVALAAAAIGVRYAQLTAPAPHALGRPAAPAPAFRPTRAAPDTAAAHQPTLPSEPRSRRMRPLPAAPSDGLHGAGEPLEAAPARHLERLADPGLAAPITDSTAMPERPAKPSTIDRPGRLDMHANERRRRTGRARASTRRRGSSRSPATARHRAEPHTRAPADSPRAPTPASGPQPRAPEPVDPLGPLERMRLQ